MILWDVSSGTPLRRLRGHVARVTSVQCNEESTVAVSGSQDNTVMCWDVRSRNIRPIQVGDVVDCLKQLYIAGSNLKIIKDCWDEN